MRLFILCLPLLAATAAEPWYNALPLMHLTEPEDTAWDRTLPTPDIPAPPTEVGLLDAKRLRPAEPVAYSGNEALAAAAAAGAVAGSGTAEDPYVIQDLDIAGITDTAGILVEKVTMPLIIRNIRVVGTPANPTTPAAGAGIELTDCTGVRIERCEVSRCRGIHAGGMTQRDILVAQCLVYSCRRGVFTGHGSHVTARGNLLVDEDEYGIFLYNGTDHTIEGNYVAWSGREGIGTNGKSARQTYRHNVILRAAWTAINCEGMTDDSLIEGNLVVDTHYGIIAMGDRTVCRDNRVFYGSQMGISVYSNKGHPNADMQVLDNLVVATGEDGINVMPYSRGVVLRGNRVWQSHTGINVSGPDFVIEANDVNRFYQGVKIGPSAWANDPMYAGDKPAAQGRGRLADNRVYGGRNGILLDGVTGVDVTGNEVHHTVYGVSTKKCADVVVAGNRMQSVTVGPLANADGTKLVIRDNDVRRTGYGAITLNDCTDCVVATNTLRNIGLSGGLQVRGGGNHEIRGNTMSDIRGGLGYKIGAITLESTHDNLIAANTFARALVGVYFAGEPSRGRPADEPPNAANVLRDNTYTDNEIDVSIPGVPEAFPPTNQLDTEAKKR